MPVTTVTAPYPNPPVDHVTIEVHPARPGEVRWAVFTTAYRKIREGSAESDGRPVALVWDLRDAAGAPVANGVYYVRVEVGWERFVIRKVLILR